MKILSIDSASSGCSVCVYEDGKLHAHLSETMARGQDSRLVPMIQDAMAKAAQDYTDLDCIAVTRGPGSFTGIRIGLATARGIGLAARKPVVGIDRFSIYRTLHAQETKPLLVVLESRRRELFVFRFEKDTLFDPANADMLDKESIIEFLSRNPDWVVAGDVQDSLFANLSANIEPARFLKPSKTEVEACAMLAMTASIGSPAFLPRPLYLRAPDVTISKAQTHA